MITDTLTGLLADPVGWGHHMEGWGTAVFGWLLMALIVVLVAWLIWTTAAGGRHREPPHGTALDVLAERYARGEIDRDEYLQRKNDLTQR
jgi:putative membrane protein